MSGTCDPALMARIRSGQVGAQQRLAAGQADLAHPQAHERLRDPHHLRQRHQLGIGQKGIPGAKHLLWHAIGAAEIAAVRHRDAEIAQGPEELVFDVH